MKEEWKDITGYEGLYQISNYGRLKVSSKTPFNSKGNTRKQAGGYIWKFSDEGVVECLC